MATNTAPTSPAIRRQAEQVVNTLRKTVNYSDAGIDSGLAFDNAIPQGAFILSVHVEIVTAFNAGSTNVLTVGTNSTSYNDMVTSADVNEAVTGDNDVTRGRGRGIAASASKVPYVKYTQTGGAATAGVAVVMITYDGGWDT